MCCLRNVSKNTPISRHVLPCLYSSDSFDRAFCRLPISRALYATLLTSCALLGLVSPCMPLSDLGVERMPECHSTRLFILKLRVQSCSLLRLLYILDNRAPITTPSVSAFIPQRSLVIAVLDYLSLVPRLLTCSIPVFVPQCPPVITALDHLYLAPHSPTRPHLCLCPIATPISCAPPFVTILVFWFPVPVVCCSCIKGFVIRL